MANEFKVKNGLIVIGDLTTSGTITINGALAATQSWVTSQAYLTSASLSGYATQSYVTSAISALVDAAPAALDTLNELAAALGDDANFSTTITNSLASKMPYYHGALSGDPGSAINGVTRIYPSVNGPSGTAHFTVFTALQDNNSYGWQFTALANEAYFRSKDTTYAGWNRLWSNSDFSSTNVSNWNTAYSWGNHASAGYLTSYIETDTLQSVTSRGSSTSTDITIGGAGGDRGLRINHGSGALDYGRIRFYQDSSNISTIHSFSTAWQSGNVLVSGGAINITGNTGVTFGSWNVPDVVFRLGGSSYFRNNVGIGTTAPDSPLEVNGRVSIRGGNELYFGQSTSFIGSWTTRMYASGSTHKFNANEFIFNNEGYGGSEYMRITSAGNIGVNTTTPYAGTGVTSVTINASSYPILAFQNNGSRTGELIGYYNHLALNTPGFIALSPGDSEAMRITTGGNVGIGTNSPTGKLHITASGGDGSAILRITGTASDAFNWASSTLYSNLIVGETAIHQIGKAESQYNAGHYGYRHTADGSSSNMLTMGMFQADYLVNILGNGNVGIGTISPGYKLEVIGTGRFSSLLQVSGPGAEARTDSQGISFFNGNLDYRISFDSQSGTRGFIRYNVDTAGSSLHGHIFSAGDYNGSVSDLMLVRSDGKIGIGTLSPAEELHVLGRGIFDGGSGNSSTDAVVYITKSNNNDWGLYVNAAALDYGMYARVSPSAGYAIGVNNGTNWTTRITGDGRIYLNEKDTIASYDTWLRLNESSHYGSGVYTPGVMRADGGFYIGGNAVWYPGNDGSGSGLDADLLDGQHGSYFINTSNIGSQSVSYASSAGSATTSTSTYRGIIEDTRTAERTPNDYDDYRVSWEFTNQIPGLSGSSWWSLMTLQGWHNAYAAWQIIGPSDAGPENWYLRVGNNTTWGTARRIWHSGDFTSTNVSNWNTAYGWGNHASAGYLTSVTAHTQAWSTITSTPTTISGYGITNAYTDAQIQNFFNGANAISGYNKSNWDTAYSWGNHASAGYLRLNTWEGNSYIGTSGAHYGTVFYDSNDTSYYADPSSTSNLNNLSVVGYQYIGGQTSNGQSNYQWSGATYQTPGDWTARLILRRDNASTGVNGSIPSLVIFNNNGADQTTASMVFASNECVTGSNSVNLAGIVAKKESVGNCGGWSAGSLNFFVKNYGSRVDSLALTPDGNATFSGLVYSTGYGNSSQWNTAYSWGNHASSGYIVAGSTISDTGSWTNATKFKSSGDISNAGAGNHSLQIFSDTNNDAFIAFHISGDYAVYFGVDDATNRLHTGGWSEGAAKYQLWDSRDFTSSNVSNWNTAYSWGNHASYSYATTSYVTTQINNLIAGAPGALDTLDELAAALGDDSNFATTVTNSIATKLPLAGGTMSGTISFINNLGTALQGTIGDNDFWRIHANSTSSNAGYLEIATSDDGTEPIYVRQYTGVFSSLTRTATLLDGAGNTAFPGNLNIGGFLTESSSLKLKENIETSEGNLEKVVNLRPVTYNKIGSEVTELGLIAEEVAEVYPEFVQYDENGEPIGVNYSRLTAALIGAVKELTNQVQELNKKING